MKLFQIFIMIFVISIIGMSQEVFAAQEFTFDGGGDGVNWSDNKNWVTNEGTPDEAPIVLDCEDPDNPETCDKAIIPSTKVVTVDTNIEQNGIIDNSGKILVNKIISGDGKINNFADAEIKILDGATIELNINAIMINNGLLLISDGTLDLEGTLQNFYNITNQGTLENFGIINNQCGVIKNLDSLILDQFNGAGIINNLSCENGKSTITSSENAEIDSTGEINNEDEIIIFGTINNNNGGVITNNGIFSLVFLNEQVQASLNNFNEIENKKDGVIEINGEFVNANKIFNSGIIRNDVNGQVSNSGQIINDCTGDFIDNGGFFEGNDVVDLPPGECEEELFCGKPKSAWEPNVIEGTSGNDRLYGSNKADLILGFEGNDKIFGSNGNDCLIGGPGWDYIRGGNGKDILEGGQGKDLLIGDNGNDKLDGGEDRDLLVGKNGKDVIVGGPGNDFLKGNNGNDELFGNEGNDFLNGGKGKDFCDGGTGNNRIKNCENDTPQPSQCNPMTINFNEFETGEIINNQLSSSGISIKVKNDKRGHPDKGIIFDSSNPTGNDKDLRTPTNKGNLAGESLQKLLIIAENIKDKNNDGLVDDPDDEARGGSIFFEFESSQCSLEFDLVDIETKEAKKGFIKFVFGSHHDDNDRKHHKDNDDDDDDDDDERRYLKIKFDKFTKRNSPYYDNSIRFGDNSANRFSLSLDDIGKKFKKIEIHFKNSGAVDNLSLNTIP